MNEAELKAEAEKIVAAVEAFFERLVGATHEDAHDQLDEHKSTITDAVTAAVTTTTDAPVEEAETDTSGSAA